MNQKQRETKRTDTRVLVRQNMAVYFRSAHFGTESLPAGSEYEIVTHSRLGDISELFPNDCRYIRGPTEPSLPQCAIPFKAFQLFGADLFSKEVVIPLMQTIYS